MLRSGDSKLSLLLDNAETVLDKERKEKTRTGDWDPEGEIRTLTFWRALTAECISTFLYVLLLSCISKTISSTPDLPESSAQVYCGVVAGLAIISLTTIFYPVSGAHINPAISLATALIRKVSPIRAIGHVVAQCGGAIAGASVVLGLYGASGHVPPVTVTNFGLEFLLSFMIVLVYLRVTDDTDQHDSALSIGISYMAALAAYRGALNPAFALGQAFVANRFDNHWIFWIGPLVGGCCAALSHEYIFNDQKDVDFSLANIISESVESTAKDSDKETGHRNKQHNSRAANKSEVLHSESDSVFEDHIHRQTEHVPQAVSKPRTHGRSYSFHNEQGKRISKVPRDQRYNNHVDEVTHSNGERLRHISGERIHHNSSDGLHHIPVERYTIPYNQVTNLNESQSRNNQFRCEQFTADTDVPVERYSGDSSGYWSRPEKKNDKSHHRKSFHENSHALKHNNFQEPPNLRHPKGGTLPRELCHPTIRVKPKHMTSLHNLCENNHADPRSIVY